MSEDERVFAIPSYFTGFAGVEIILSSVPHQEKCLHRHRKDTGAEKIVAHSRQMGNPRGFAR